MWKNDLWKENVACVDLISGEYIGQGEIECSTDWGYIVNMDDGTQREFLPYEVIPMDEYNRR